MAKLYNANHPFIIENYPLIYLHFAVPYEKQMKRPGETGRQYFHRIGTQIKNRNQIKLKLDTHEEPA